MNNCVLVIVPNPERAGKIAGALRRSGWWAPIAANPTNALASAATLTPDFIVLEAGSDPADANVAAALKQKIDGRRPPAGKTQLIVLVDENVVADAFMSALEPDLVLRSDVPASVLRGALVRLAKHAVHDPLYSAGVGLISKRWGPRSAARSGFWHIRPASF